MISKSTLYLQFKELLPLLFAVYTPTFLALVLLVLVNLQTGIPIAYLTRDSTAAVQVPFYAGIYSKIGMLFWCSAVAICFFSVGILRNRSANTESVRFLLFSGMFTTILLLDDFFLLHEEVLPDYLHIPQKLVFVVYGTLSVLYLIRFRAFILKTEFLLLFLAFGFFGLSIAVDILPGHSLGINFIASGFRGHHLFEDGFKLLGIVSWSTYFIKICVNHVRSLLHLASHERFDAHQKRNV